MIKLIAFDLDGTLTCHKTPLGDENRRVLEALAKKYKLLMVGAGGCRRIFEQMGRFPIDIIGNYGMQYAEYDPKSNDLVTKQDDVVPCDKKSCEERVAMLRNKHGFTEYAGDSVEFHASGCVTFAILGTKARIEDKLSFDPDRSRRRAIYDEVCSTFSDYNVFVGGSSSFDMAPAPYNKYYALAKYCEEHGIAHSEVIFVGDDYGLGGNDESVYRSDFGFLTIDDYRDLPSVVAHLI